MLQDIGGLLPYLTTPLAYPTNLVGIIQMLMPCLGYNGPEAVDISPQTVQAVCEGVQALHGKVETLCHGAQAVGILSQDTMPAGMTSLEWSQAQMQDPAISHIIHAIQTKHLNTIKHKQNMSSDLKAFLRIRKQLKIKTGCII